MQRKDLEAGHGVLTRAEANEPQSPSVRYAARNGALAKIFVQRQPMHRTDACVPLPRHCLRRRPIRA